jgi:hypothetical protein
LARSSSRPPPPSIQDAIGRVSCAWAILELTLSIILGELMEVKPDTAMVVSAALDHRHHRDLIGSLAALKLKDHPVANRLTAFMGAVRGMNKERNEAIHSVWTIHPVTDRLMRLTMRNQGVFEGKFHRGNTRHLVTVQRKIIALSNEGVGMASEIREAVHTWREKFGVLDWPRLEPTEEHHPESNLDTPLAPLAPFLE